MFAAGQRLGEMQQGFIEQAVSKPFLQGDCSSAKHDRGGRREKLRIGVKLFIPPLGTGRERNEAVDDASLDGVDEIEVTDRSSEQARLCEDLAEVCTLPTRVCQIVSRAILPESPPSLNLIHN